MAAPGPRLRRRRSVVFLLHGLGALPVVMVPLQLHLMRHGFPHTFALAYDVDTPHVATSVASASRAMLRILQAPSPQVASARWDVLVVGHSWGGLTGNRLHGVGWRLRGAVYLAAPLHGARVLQWVPQWLQRRAYSALRHKAQELPPPHPYRTISCGHFHGTFDGAVFRDETVLEPRWHTHLAWEDHSWVLIKPRMWRLVRELLSQMTGVDRRQRGSASAAHGPRATS